MVMGAYFKGVRLWEVLQEMKTPAARTGAGAHSGVTADYGLHNPGSPNFARECSARCVIEPVEDSGATSDLEAESDVLIALMRVDTRLVAVSKTQGHLSWCEDVARLAAITGGPYTAGSQVISHGAAGGSWTPTAARIVLCCNKATGVGFVATISAVGGGTITITVPADTTVTSDWVFIDVQAAVPSCVYNRMTYGDRTVFMNGEWRPAVEYSFSAFADPIYAAAHAVPVDDA